MVAVVGYIVSFDKSTFRAHRGESNLFFSLAQWHNNKLSISVPPELELNVPSLVLIYDKDGNIYGVSVMSLSWSRTLRKAGCKSRGFMSWIPGRTSVE